MRSKLLSVTGLTAIVRSRLKSRGLLWGLTVALVIGGVLLWWHLRRVEADATYSGAVAALDAGLWEEAEEFGRRLTRWSRYAPQGWLIAGEAAARQGFGDRALACYQEVPQDGSRLARTALLACGELYLKALPALGEADRVYRQVLAAEPDNLVANERLAYVLGLQGRAGEAAVHRLALLRQGKVLPLQLVLLALGDSADENPETADVFHRANPDDVLACLALGRIAAQRERLAEAQTWLTKVVAQRPDLARAQAWLGRTLLRAKGPAACAAWDAALPASADDSPDIWLVRGDAARQANQPRVAVRCYGEAVRREPNQLAALYGLARMLRSLGQTQPAEPFLERARRVEPLANAARTYEIARVPWALEQAAATAQQLGLAWESWGWYEAMARTRPLRDEERQQQQAALAEARETPHDRTAARGRPIERFELAAFPLPDRSRLSPSTSLPQDSVVPVLAPASAHNDRGIAFRDDTASAGIDFRYRNGSRPETAGEYMYEFSGGGVAVLDFDRDGWPDLYFTQGPDWPPREDNFRHLDRLYRNMGNGRFVDITESAGYNAGRPMRTTRRCAALRFGVQVHRIDEPAGLGHFRLHPVPLGSPLTLEEREVIAPMHRAGKMPTQIADRLGRSKSTISRELRRNRSRNGYWAVAAQLSHHGHWASTSSLRRIVPATATSTRRTWWVLTGCRWSMASDSDEPVHWIPSGRSAEGLQAVCQSVRIAEPALCRGECQMTSPGRCGSFPAWLLAVTCTAPKPCFTLTIERRKMLRQEDEAELLRGAFRGGASERERRALCPVSAIAWEVLP